MLYKEPIIFNLHIIIYKKDVTGKVTLNYFDSCFSGSRSRTTQHVYQVVIFQGFNQKYSGSFFEEKEDLKFSFMANNPIADYSRSLLSIKGAIFQEL